MLCSVKDGASPELSQGRCGQGVRGRAGGTRPVCIAGAWACDPRVLLDQLNLACQSRLSGFLSRVVVKIR